MEILLAGHSRRYGPSQQRIRRQIAREKFTLQDLRGVDDRMIGIELRDRDFIGAVREERAQRARVACVFSAKQTLDRLEKTPA